MTEPVHIRKIQEILPHRYPFLLVDRILEVEPGVRLLARKNVTVNEPFFNGHFPTRPIMPGVLICEALAQAAGLLSYYTAEYDKGGKVIFLMGLDRARFRQPVTPGDVLELEVSLLKQRRDIWKFRGEARVDGKKVAECELMATVRDASEVDE